MVASSLCAPLSGTASSVSDKKSAWRAKAGSSLPDTSCDPERMVLSPSNLLTDSIIHAYVHRISHASPFQVGKARIWAVFCRRSLSGTPMQVHNDGLNLQHMCICVADCEFNGLSLCIAMIVSSSATLELHMPIWSICGESLPTFRRVGHFACSFRRLPRVARPFQERP
jgi:hypothetical protein